MGCANGGYLNYTTSGGTAFCDDGQRGPGRTLTPIGVAPSLSATYQSVDGGYYLTMTGAGLQPDAQVLVSGTGMNGPFGPTVVGTVLGTGEFNYAPPYRFSCGEYSALNVRDP